MASTEESATRDCSRRAEESAWVRPFRGLSGNRILQAATSKIIWDETRKCNLCDKATQAVCEECGRVVCHEHTRLCSSCRKHLCTECVTTKGVINKSPLCHRCKK